MKKLRSVSEKFSFALPTARPQNRIDSSQTPDAKKPANQQHAEPPSAETTPRHPPVMSINGAKSSRTQQRFRVYLGGKG